MGSFKNNKKLQLVCKKYLLIFVKPKKTFRDFQQLSVSFRHEFDIDIIERRFILNQILKENRATQKASLIGILSSGQGKKL